MKKTKVIIPALGLLLLSTAASITGTVAWFSMNTSVSATGMQVKVKSENTFLLINTGNTNTASAIQSAGLTTVATSVSDNEAQVYPSSPILSSFVSDSAQTDFANNKYFVAGTTVVSNASTAATAANWFTAVNHNPGSHNDSVQNVNVLNTTANDTYEFSKYVIKRTVYLTLAVGSNNANSLTVTPDISLKDEYVLTSDTALANGKTYYTLANDVYTAVESPNVANIASYYEKLTADDISAVKVLVATGDNYVILDSSMSTAQSLHETTNDTLTPSSVLTVDMYLYYDGESSVVYTNNLADLAAANVELEFGVEIA